MSESLLIATRSAGKLRELGSLLRPLGCDLLTLDDLGIAETAEEDGLECFETFEENALAKVRYFAAKTGLVTVADDSGLEVDALGGRPGVHSKRWSGLAGPDDEQIYEANRQKLLSELGDTANRRARFVCVAAYAAAGVEWTVRGECTGVITHEARGAGGFGYDPLFLSDDLGRTLAECTGSEKESVSHRGRAFAALVNRLRTGAG